MTTVVIGVGILLYLMAGCIFAFLMYTQTTAEMTNAELVTCVLLWPISLLIVLIVFITGKS